MFPIPKCVFLTRGIGTHRQQLSAFEYALRDADIEQQNLVSVSSILPAQCELIPHSAGIAALSPGEITFMSNLIVDTHSIAAAAHGAPRSDWTCVVAAAVFLFTPSNSA
jgi:pyruvoyl-dependent arginine decarboxylase